MIDFHSHLLPALDDGAITVDDSIAMARALAAFGYKAVCCTPHCIKGYYELAPKQVREATLILQADLDNEGIQLELWPGMEYMLDECFSEFAEDLLPLGDTKLVLCEAPPQAHPLFVQEGLELIAEKGFVPLVAHPERTQFFYDKITQHVASNASRNNSKNRIENVFKDSDESFASSRSPLGFIKNMFSPRVTRPAPRALDPTTQTLNSSVQEYCLFHANLGSFTGFYGAKVQSNAYELLKLGVYTAIATDLHDSRSAVNVLVQDKFENNPFLKKLAQFDGVVPEMQAAVKPGKGEQIGLF